jgi:hypothetical protein
LADVAVTEVEVQAWGHGRGSGYPDRREVRVTDVSEGGKGLLVPINLRTQVAFQVGEVVGGNAALGVVGLGRAGPAGAHVMATPDRVTAVSIRSRFRSRD